MQSLIRDVPKPVIARVQGFAIGGGNVLATLCDLTIASEKAVFGQVGPKVGSVDPGFGTAYLARLVGEKRAREIWYLCRRYSAKEALDMGLVNAVVPHDKLDEEVDKWCAEIRERSPTAIAIAKRSFNADTEQLRGLSSLGFEAVSLFYNTEESKEGGRAFREKRPPKFRLMTNDRRACWLPSPREAVGRVGERSAPGWRADKERISPHPTPPHRFAGEGRPIDRSREINH